MLATQVNVMHFATHCIGALCDMASPATRSEHFPWYTGMEIPHYAASFTTRN